MAAPVLLKAGSDGKTSDGEEAPFAAQAADLYSRMAVVIVLSKGSPWAVA